MRSMRMITSMAKFSGNDAMTRAACSGLSLVITTATVWGYSFLK